MTKFKRLIIENNVDINRVIKNSRYRMYRKWFTGEIADPRISSLKLFIEDFGEQHIFDLNELANCFTYGEEENDDFILTITSNWLPRRNLSIIKQLIYTKYYSKKILVVNATPYADLIKEFGVDSNDELRIRELDISHFPSIDDFEASIYKSNYPEIDFINLVSKNNESMPLAEQEKESVCAFRQVLSKLEGYDNIIIACSNNPISMTRLLGAVANNCITFSDALPYEYCDRIKMYHTVSGFNDRFIILDALERNRDGSCNHNENYLNYVGNFFGERISRELEQ